MLFADACYELCRPISDELTSKRRASSEMKTALTTDAHRLFPSSVTIVPSVVRSSSLLRIRRPLLLPEVGSSSPVLSSVVAKISAILLLIWHNSSAAQKKRQNLSFSTRQK